MVAPHLWAEPCSSLRGPSFSFKSHSTALLAASKSSSLLRLFSPSRSFVRASCRRALSVPRPSTTTRPAAVLPTRVGSREGWVGMSGGVSWKKIQGKKGWSGWSNYTNGQNYSTIFNFSVPIYIYIYIAWLVYL